MQQFSNSSSVMESETISKNGRSLKSHTSKGIMFSLLLLIAFLSFGCDKIETIDEFPMKNPIIIFDSEGGTKDIKMEFSGTIKICDEDEDVLKWITVTKTGNTGEQIFHLTASKNESNEIRTGYIQCCGTTGTNTVQVAAWVISIVQYGQDIKQ